MWWLILILVVTGLLLLCFLLAVANFSGDRFMEKYEKMKKLYPASQMSTIEFISRLNAKYFKSSLQIVQISTISKYAYSKGKLFLSTETLKNPSLASFTIIAHETGHALQDISGNKLKVLHKLRRLGKVLGVLMLPSIIAGGILMIIGQNLFFWGIGLVAFGVLIFFLALFIKLRTISIEKDASKNAIKFLSEFFDEKDLKYCKSFLNSARLTYWAEFLRLCLGWTAMSRKAKLFN